MGKRSNKRALRYENHQAGCIWGLISVFDFRYGRSTRKLLSDREHARRDAASSSGIGTKLKMLTNSDEKLKSIEKKIMGGEESEIPKADLLKTSVKELMEEEMFSEKDSKNHIKPVKADEARNIGSENLDNLDLEGIIEELRQYHKRNPSSDLDMRSNDEENLSEAIKVFIDQRFKEESKTSHSIEFVDALKTLSSNKELFLNLLKDPNSPLVKHIQSIDDSRLGKGQNNSRTHRSFFKRRSKSQESNSLKGNEEFQPSNRIVILKPGPTGQGNPSTNKNNLDDDIKVISKTNASQFSFMGIKKRLKHVMGKEKLEESRNQVFDERVGWSSPNRNHFYTEKFAKPYNAGKKEPKVSKTPGVSSIYIEAKKHLSEMLTNGEDKEVMTRQLPKTLGRIISLPEYNYSPWGSPGKYGEGEAGFITAQMRLSPRINFNIHQPAKEDNTVHLSSPKQETVDNPVEKEESSNLVLNVKEENSLQSFVGNETSLEGTVIAKEHEEEGSFLITSNDKNADINEVCEEERYSFSVKPDLFEDPSFSSPLVSPSSSSQTKKIEDQDSTAVDKTERPSPVSVLEPFSEDEISPSTTKFRTAIQPLQIRFDEGICTRAREEIEESAFEYVEAVLLASGLNWDEYLMNRFSSNQLLHPSLFDEVELFSNRPSDDQKLLFDCTNEVLEEIYKRYFKYPFIKRKIRPVPCGSSLIQEVWEGVEWHLLRYPLSYSLDQLVKKDIAKSGSWMDLQFETDDIVIELVNMVLEEMIEETVFSF